MMKKHLFHVLFLLSLALSLSGQYFQKAYEMVHDTTGPFNFPEYMVLHNDDQITAATWDGSLVTIDTLGTLVDEFTVGRSDTSLGNEYMFHAIDNTFACDSLNHWTHTGFVIGGREVPSRSPSLMKYNSSTMGFDFASLYNFTGRFYGVRTLRDSTNCPMDRYVAVGNLEAPGMDYAGVILFIDGNGNVESSYWTNVGGLNEPQYFSSVMIDRNRDIVVIGRYAGTTNITKFRYDGTAHVLWSRMYNLLYPDGLGGSAYATEPSGIVQLDSDDYLLYGGNGVFARLDTAGNVVWAQQYQLSTSAYTWNFTNADLEVLQDGSIGLFGLYNPPVGSFYNMAYLNINEDGSVNAVKYFEENFEVPGSDTYNDRENLTGSYLHEFQDLLLTGNKAVASMGFTASTPDGTTETFVDFFNFEFDGHRSCDYTCDEVSIQPVEHGSFFVNLPSYFAAKTADLNLFPIHINNYYDFPCQDTHDLVTPVVNFTTIKQPCIGECNGRMQVDISGYTGTLTWTFEHDVNGTVGSGVVTLPGGVFPTFNFLCEGGYTLTLEGDCHSYTYSTTLYPEKIIKKPVITGETNICPYESSSLHISLSTAVDFQWSIITSPPGATANLTSTSGPSTIFTPDPGISPAVYVLQIEALTASGCVGAILEVSIFVEPCDSSPCYDFSNVYNNNDLIDQNIVIEDVVVDEDQGFIYACGYSTSPITPYIVQLEINTGTVIWTRQITYPDLHTFCDVHLSRDGTGDVLLLGTHDPLPSIGNLYVLRMDMNGNLTPPTSSCGTWTGAANFYEITPYSATSYAEIIDASPGGDVGYVLVYNEHHTAQDVIIMNPLDNCGVPMGPGEVSAIQCAGVERAFDVLFESGKEEIVIVGDRSSDSSCVNSRGGGILYRMKLYELGAAYNYDLPTHHFLYSPPNDFTSTTLYRIAKDTESVSMVGSHDGPFNGMHDAVIYNLDTTSNYSINWHLKILDPPATERVDLVMDAGGFTYFAYQSNQYSGVIAKIDPTGHLVSAHSINDLIEPQLMILHNGGSEEMLVYGSAPAGLTSEGDFVVKRTSLDFSTDDCMFDPIDLRDTMWSFKPIQDSIREWQASPDTLHQVGISPDISTMEDDYCVCCDDFFIDFSLDQDPAIYCPGDIISGVYLGIIGSQIQVDLYDPNGILVGSVSFPLMTSPLIFSSIIEDMFADMGVENPMCSDQPYTVQITAIGTGEYNGCMAMDEASFVYQCECEDCFAATDPAYMNMNQVFGLIIDGTDDTNGDGVVVLNGKYYVEQIIEVEGVVLDITGCDLVFDECAGLYFSDSSLLRANNSVFRPCDMNLTWNGVILNNDTTNIVNDCDFKNAWVGVAFSVNAKGRVQNNLFQNCNAGIALFYAQGFTHPIVNNTFTFDQDMPDFTVIDSCAAGSTFHFGSNMGILYLGAHANCEVSQNNFVHNYPGTDNAIGVSITGGSVTGKISENTFTDFTHAIAFQAVGNIPPDFSQDSTTAPDGQFTIENNEIEVSRLFHHGSAQILVHNSMADVSIVGNEVRSTFTGQNLSQLFFGISVAHAANVDIVDNEVAGGFHTGIYADSSHFIRTMQNEVYDFERMGIIYSHSTQGTISCNEVQGNNYHVNNTTGIAIAEDDSQDIDIYSNCVSNTHTAISLGSQNEVENHNLLIRDNFLFNYSKFGIVNKTFKDLAIGTSDTDPGQNTFWSNSTAFDVFATTPTTLWDNYGVFTISAPMVSILHNEQEYSTAACGRQVAPPYSSQQNLKSVYSCDHIEQNWLKQYQPAVALQSVRQTANARSGYEVATAILKRMYHKDMVKAKNWHQLVMSGDVLSPYFRALFDYHWLVLTGHPKDALAHLERMALVSEDIQSLYPEQLLLKNALGTIDLNALNDSDLTTLKNIAQLESHRSNAARSILMSHYGQSRLYVGGSLPDLISEESENVFSVGEWGLTLFPNPVGRELSVRVNTDRVSQLVVYNMMGQTVYSLALSFTNGEVTIDVGNLAKGVYWVVIQDNSGRRMQEKFVKS